MLFDNTPQTKEKLISVTHDCIWFIDRYQFLSSSLGSLVKPLVDNNQKQLKIEKR